MPDNHRLPPIDSEASFARKASEVLYRGFLYAGAAVGELAIMGANRFSIPGESRESDWGAAPKHQAMRDTTAEMLAQIDDAIRGGR